MFFECVGVAPCRRADIVWSFLQSTPDDFDTNRDDIQMGCNMSGSLKSSRSGRICCGGCREIAPVLLNGFIRPKLILIEEKGRRGLSVVALKWRRIRAWVV